MQRARIRVISRAKVLMKYTRYKLFNVHNIGFSVPLALETITSFGTKHTISYASCKYPWEDIFVKYYMKFLWNFLWVIPYDAKYNIHTCISLSFLLFSLPQSLYLHFSSLLLYPFSPLLTSHRLSSLPLYSVSPLLTSHHLSSLLLYPASPLLTSLHLSSIILYHAYHLLTSYQLSSLLLYPASPLMISPHFCFTLPPLSFPHLSSSLLTSHLPCLHSPHLSSYLLTYLPCLPSHHFLSLLLYSDPLLITPHNLSSRIFYLVPPLSSLPMIYPHCSYILHPLSSPLIVALHFSSTLPPLSSPLIISLQISLFPITSSLISYPTYISIYPPSLPLHIQLSTFHTTHGYSRIRNWKCLDKKMKGMQNQRKNSNVVQFHDVRKHKHYYNRREDINLK